MIALADLVTQLQTLRRRAEGTVLTTVLQPDELQAVKDAADRLARLEALMQHGAFTNAAYFLGRPDQDVSFDHPLLVDCQRVIRDLLQLRGTGEPG